MGYCPEDTHEARAILEEDLAALRSVFGAKNADASRLARRGQAVIMLLDGTTAHMEFAPGVT